MLTHLDSQGRAHMVDVTDKATTFREATAEARVRMLPATLQMIVAGEHPKGDVFAVARIAGIQAAKKTSDLILWDSSTLAVRGLVARFLT